MTRGRPPETMKRVSSDGILGAWHQGSKAGVSLMSLQLAKESGWDTLLRPKLFPRFTRENA